MVRWHRVLVRRLACWSSLAIVVSGCWDDDRIGGAFTDEQLAAIRAQYVLPPLPPPCPQGTGDRQCSDLRQLGQRMFFDKTLSSTGTVSCATCHDPNAWFVDSRRDADVSLGVTDWTRRNAMTLVNVGLKPGGTFTWTGAMPLARDVIEQIAWPRAMGTSTVEIGGRLRADPAYATAFEQAFASACGDTDAGVGRCASTALESYTRWLVSVDSPFDRFIAGDDSALSPAALRGFGVFVGRGMCAECHAGPLLTDQALHVTGVEQAGLHAPTSDTGRDNTGAFMTSTLRNIAETGPYMHDGSMHSLADVVDFYRWGGGQTNYVKDAMMEPLEIDDADAADLVAFLQTLTGSTVPKPLREQPAP
jgi:cytochrome c peroxidase